MVTENKEEAGPKVKDLGLLNPPPNSLENSSAMKKYHRLHRFTQIIKKNKKICVICVICGSLFFIVFDC
jgi:hypothetical protein